MVYKDGSGYVNRDVGRLRQQQKIYVREARQWGQKRDLHRNDEDVR